MAVNYSEAALLGRAANGVAGSVTFYDKKLIGVVAGVTSTTVASVLENKGYTFAVNIGNDVRSFGSAKTGSDEWIDIILAMTWIKTNVRDQVYLAIANTEKLGYTNEGATVIESAVRSVLSQGQQYNLIARDVTPTVITPNVLDLTPQQRSTRVLPNVRFSCRLEGAIHATTINGEVYV